MKRIKAGDLVRVNAGGDKTACKPATGVWRVVRLRPLSVYSYCRCCRKENPDCYICDRADIVEVCGPRTKQSLPVIYGGHRSDNYDFILLRTRRGINIKAGCRSFKSFADAREHWKNTRGGTALGNQSLAFLRKMERQAKREKWL